MERDMSAVTFRCILEWIVQEKCKRLKTLRLIGDNGNEQTGGGLSVVSKSWWQVD